MYPAQLAAIPPLLTDSSSHYVMSDHHEMIACADSISYPSKCLHERRIQKTEHREYIYVNLIASKYIESSKYCAFLILKYLFPHVLQRFLAIRMLRIRAIEFNYHHENERYFNVNFIKKYSQYSQYFLRLCQTIC